MLLLVGFNRPLLDINKSSLNVLLPPHTMLIDSCRRVAGPDSNSLFNLYELLYFILLVSMLDNAIQDWKKMLFAIHSGVYLTDDIVGN